HQGVADRELLGAPQLLLRLEKTTRLEMQPGQVEADARLEAGLAWRPLQPSQRLAVRGGGRLLSPELHVELPLGVEHLRHRKRLGQRLAQRPRAPQVVAGRGETALAAPPRGPLVQQAADAPLEPPRRQPGFPRPYPVATLLALERLHVRREQRLEVTRDAMKHLRDAAPQFFRLHAALPQREVRAGARPERPLVGSGNRHEEGAQGRECLEIREQREGLLHQQRGESLDQRLPQRPYSFILRVRVLRWMPRTSAAAPI